MANKEAPRLSTTLLGCSPSVTSNGQWKLKVWEKGEGQCDKISASKLVRKR